MPTGIFFTYKRFFTANSLKFWGVLIAWPQQKKGLMPFLPGLGGHLLGSHRKIDWERHAQGENSPIFRLIQQLELHHFGKMRLNSTPGRPCPCWDAGSERILVVGILEYNFTEQTVLACCTHLDNAGNNRRRNIVASIASINDRLRKDWYAYAVSFHHPNSFAADTQQDLHDFLSDDFNSFPDQEASLAMQKTDLMCVLRLRRALQLGMGTSSPSQPSDQTGIKTSKAESISSGLARSIDFQPPVLAEYLR